MPLPLLLRSYHATDLPRLLELFHASVHEVCGADYTSKQLAAWAPTGLDPTSWLTRFTHQEVLLAQTGEALAGFCSWTRDGYLDLLYVHPDRLRRRVATALYGAAEMSLRARNIPRIQTQASLTAQPFFLRQGFRLLRSQTVSVRGVDLPNALMEKGLT